MYIDDDEWRRFVEDHPELRPEPLAFTDEQLLTALADAERQWRDYREQHGHVGRADHGVDSRDVANVLAGRSAVDTDCAGPSPTAGDVIRVGRALARLARQGRTRRANKTWEQNRWAMLRETA